MGQPTEYRNERPIKIENVGEQVGNVQYFKTLPEFYLWDIVEICRDDRCVVDIGVVTSPTAEEMQIDHKENDVFVDWSGSGRNWTDPTTFTHRL